MRAAEPWERKDAEVDKDARIYVAGGGTLIGSAILGELERRGFRNLAGRPGSEPDLSRSEEVDSFFRHFRPQFVFAAGGRTGGIGANLDHPAGLMLDNLLAQCHLFESAFRHGTGKLLFLASSCCYPRNCPQPMREEYLLTGPLEPSSEAYALAKLSGIKLCQAYRRQYRVDFISAICGDCFGPGDDFSPENAHVVPALMARMHQALLKGEGRVVIWGSGEPRRDFIFVEDLARACLTAIEVWDDESPLNLGSGGECSIADLARQIQEISGFRGELVFDRGEPDGAPVKLLDSRKIRTLGWKPEWPMREALARTWEWYVGNRDARAGEPGSEE